MRKVAVMVGVLGLVSSYANAGTVAFSPSGVIVPQVDAFPIAVTVSVSELAGLNGISLVIGSDTAPFAADPWEYSPESAVLANRNEEFRPVGIYTVDDIFVDANNPPASIGTSVLLGTLFVNTSNMAPGTQFEVQVDSVRDGDFSQLILQLAGQSPASEGVAGIANFTVVPEPATLCMLGLGAVGLLRRRFV